MKGGRSLSFTNWPSKREKGEGKEEREGREEGRPSFFERLLLARAFFQSWLPGEPPITAHSPLGIHLGKCCGQFLKCENQHLLQHRSSGLPKPHGAGSPGWGQKYLQLVAATPPHRPPPPLPPRALPTGEGGPQSQRTRSREG